MSERNFNYPTNDEIQQIMNLISQDEITKTAIEALTIYNNRLYFYRIAHKYYSFPELSTSCTEKLFMSTLSKYSEIELMIRKYVESHKYEWYEEMYIDAFGNTYDPAFDELDLFCDEDKEKPAFIKYIEYPVNKMDYWRAVANIISKVSYKISISSKKQRLNKGETIRLDECQEVHSQSNYTEFLKDGGWGICDANGIVHISNTMCIQPSKLSDIKKEFQGTNATNCLSVPNLFFVVDQDSSSIGALCIDNGILEIPMEYDRIENVKSNSETSSFFLVSKYNPLNMTYTYGLFNMYGDLLIPCKYKKVIILDNYFIIKNYEPKEDNEVERSSKIDRQSVYSLYNKTGDLLIGGFFDISHSSIGSLLVDNNSKNYRNSYVGYWTFYFKDPLGDTCCLPLDKNFCSLLKYKGHFYRMPLGHFFNNKENINDLIPEGVLFHGNDIHFIFNEKVVLIEYTEQYSIEGLIYDERDEEDRISSANNNEQASMMADYMSPEEELVERYNHPLKNEMDWGNSQYAFMPSDINSIFGIEKKSGQTEVDGNEKIIGWTEHYCEDNKTKLLTLNEYNEIVSEFIVDDVCYVKKGLFYYRINDSVGIYSHNQFQPIPYNAILEDYNYKEGDDFIVAKVYENYEVKGWTYPPYFYEKGLSENYDCDNSLGIPISRSLGTFLEFYKYSVNGEIKKIEPNGIFKPKELNWFPHNFRQLYDLYDKDDGYSENYNDEGVTDWNDEDAWDAMTDGMYGDYPGPNWDPELFGY